VKDLTYIGPTLTYFDSHAEFLAYDQIKCPAGRYNDQLNGGSIDVRQFVYYNI
jgi:hypothetical protein